MTRPDKIKCLVGRDSRMVSAGALEVKWSFKALKKCSSIFLCD